MTRNEAIVKALLARGEREITPRHKVTRWRVFTRRYYGSRDAVTGILKPVPSQVYSYWFVSHNGLSMRVQHTFMVTEPKVKAAAVVKSAVIGLLVAEGRTIK